MTPQRNPLTASAADREGQPGGRGCMTSANPWTSRSGLWGGEGEGEGDAVGGAPLRKTPLCLCERGTRTPKGGWSSFPGTLHAGEHWPRSSSKGVAADSSSARERTWILVPWLSVHDVMLTFWSVANRKYDVDKNARGCPREVRVLRVDSMTPMHVIQKWYMHPDSLAADAKATVGAMRSHGFGTP